MSQNFNPQPKFDPGLSTDSMHTPVVPQPANIGGSYLSTIFKQYYRGAARFAAGTSMQDLLPFTSKANPSTDFAYDRYIFANPLTRCGVISFWLRYAPGVENQTGLPFIGQKGNANMFAFFGTDLAHARMGSIEVQIVPMPRTAVEFAPGAT